MDNLRKRIKTVFEAILDAIIPRKCAGCGKEREIFCALCRMTSYSKWFSCVLCGARNQSGAFCAQSCRRKTPKALKKAIWAGTYDNELKEAIWQLKYKKRKELAKPLGMLLAKKLKSCCYSRDPISGNSQRWDLMENSIIIPVPLHLIKEHERGFNQARLIAEALGKEMNMPVVLNILKRIKNMAPQARALNKKTRTENMVGIFSSDTVALQPYCNATIILVDDVATTGATLFDAACALEEAGAIYIIGALVAH